MKSSTEDARQIKCPHCQRDFQTSHARQIYCTALCAQNAATLRSRRKVEKVENPLRETTCANCGIEFQTINKIVKYCSTKCAKSIKAHSYLRILERDSFRCVYCGVSSIEHGAYLTLDHIIPQVRGGDNTMLNLVTACLSCNSSKSDRRYDEPIIARLLILIKDRNTTSGLSDHAKVIAHAFQKKILSGT